MREFHDPLGFTKQTEALLLSMGARELVKEFKARNISTEELHRLTKEDFVKLGVKEEDAQVMMDTLNVSRKKTLSKNAPELHYRMSTNVEILDAAQKQLDLIQFYIAYCRLRLRKKRVDCFVEPDKAITASQILCIAADSTLKELDETELRLKELEAMIMPKSGLNHPYAFYGTLIGGICITIYKILMKTVWV